MRGLLDQLPQEQQAQMRRKQMGAAIADGMMAYGGVKPFASQGVAGQVPGLLEEQQAAQRQAANQEVLAQYAQQGLLQPHQVQLLATNPDLMEHFFKERYTGRSIAPGAALTFGGEEQYRAPNRPQAVGTDLVRPDTGELIHRAPQAPGVSVNVGGEGPRYEIGAVPQGYRQVYDEAGRPTHQELLPGSPAAREQEMERATAEARDRYRAVVGGTVVQDANRALELLESTGFFGAGAGAHIGRIFSESDAATLENLVKSIKGNIGVDQLQAMRESSPTGGALGNVTERQLEGLQGLLGVLDVTGRPAELDANLKRIHNLYMDQVHGTPEQIEMVARAKGIPLEQVAPLMERHDLPFDEFGRRPSVEVGPVTPTGPSGQATHRWNPETQRVEPIQR